MDTIKYVKGIEFIKEILEILRYTDDADNIIRNLDAEAIAKKMKVIDVIAIPEGATNGDLVKAPFYNCCHDTKTMLEDDDGKEYEAHLVHIWGTEVINRYNENWWNLPYEIGGFLND
jgi:hypothetical protein